MRVGLSGTTALAIPQQPFFLAVSTFHLPGDSEFVEPLADWKAQFFSTHGLT
jgi:hypothetical protein